jgi:hypothetical protein
MPFLDNHCPTLEKYEKLIITLRTAQANEYSLDKEQTSYDDLLHALMLSSLPFHFST